MKVLWITNIKLPPLSEHLGLKPTPFGGWMISALNQLKSQEGIEIAVATFDNCVELYDEVIEGVRYFLVPINGKNPLRYNLHLEKEWKEVNNRFEPDVVHIHGTEAPHGLAWVRANGAGNVCNSMQGLISVISRYYKTDSLLDYLPLTFRDFVKLDWISRQRRNLRKRGEIEKELLHSVKHIIGRTEWDKSHVLAINPLATYHYGGETLRDEFYKHKWEFEKCIPHSIFISQGNNPIKGLHILLQALPLVLREFPDTHLFVGGVNIIKIPWYRKTSYAVILNRIIRKNNLQGKITFLGVLDEKRMCEWYLKCNLFVLPSAIENSPNSLGEAQLLGMPFLASYVGGVPEIVNNNLAALYRYEEVEMLANKIIKIFQQGTRIKSCKSDLTRYSSKINTELLIQTYNEILNKNTDVCL